MPFSDTRVTGWCLLVLAPFIPIVGVLRLLPFEVTQGISTDIDVALWSTEGALLVAYLVPRTEHLKEHYGKIASKPVPGIEVFRRAEDLLSRIADLTIGADEVATLNLSPAPESTAALRSYFRRVDPFLARGRRTGLQSFRSIGSLNDPAKVRYLIERAQKLHGSEPVSLGVFARMPADEGFSPLGIHVVRRGDAFGSFIFPPVALTGDMQGILIYGKETYTTLLEYFNELWHNQGAVYRILEGGRLRQNGIDRLRQALSQSP